MTTSLPSADCLNAAAILEIAAEHSHEPELLQVCTNFLKEAAALGSEYLAGVDNTRPFFLEACKVITLLCRENETRGPDLHSRAFSLLECFAFIALEHSQRCGGTTMHQAHADVLRYFEDRRH